MKSKRTDPGIPNDRSPSRSESLRVAHDVGRSSPRPPEHDIAFRGKALAEEQFGLPPQSQYGVECVVAEWNLAVAARSFPMADRNNFLQKIDVHPPQFQNLALSQGGVDCQNVGQQSTLPARILLTCALQF